MFGLHVKDLVELALGALAGGYVVYKYQGKALALLAQAKEDLQAELDALKSKLGK